MNSLEELFSKINSRKVLVIAGSIREFETFIDIALYKWSQEGLYEGCEFIYYNNPDSIRGMRFDSYLYFGTGALRSDLDIYTVKMSIR
jgi:hypothetical protein